MVMLPMRKLLLLAPLAFVGGCALPQSGPSSELQEAYDAKVVEIQTLYARIQDLEARMKAEGATPEVIAETALLLSDATTKLTTAYSDLGALSEKAAQETGTPEWLLILESLAASILGVRIMRGPASKGALKSLPILGQN